MSIQDSSANIWLAIAGVGDGRVAKYQAFTTQQEATKHCAQYGGFVFENTANTPVSMLLCDGKTCGPMPAEELKRLQESQADLAKFEKWKADKKAKADKALRDEFDAEQLNAE